MLDTADLLNRTDYDLVLRGRGVFLRSSDNLASPDVLIYNVPRIIIVRLEFVNGIPVADSVEIVYIGCMRIDGPRACYKKLWKLRKADKMSNYVIPMINDGVVWQSL